VISGFTLILSSFRYNHKIRSVYHNKGATARIVAPVFIFIAVANPLLEANERYDTNRNENERRDGICVVFQPRSFDLISNERRKHS